MRYLIVFLALGGMLVSGLALRVHYSVGTEPCSINEKWDCGIVNHSEYAEVGHVPVAAIGIVGYLALAWLAFGRQRVLTAVSASIGCAFAAYLSYIEKDVLMVWCLYCVISQAIIAVSMLLSIGWMVAGWVENAQETT